MNKFSRLVTFAVLVGTMAAQAGWADDLPDAPQAQPSQGASAPSWSDIFFSRYFDLNGSSGTLQWRDQGSAAGGTDLNQMQYAVDLRFAIGLTADGKLRIIGRALSGNSYNDAYNNVGVGNNSNVQGNVALRNLYLDYAISDHVSAQVGSMTSEPDGVMGVFDFDRDGWVDGGRLNYKGINGWVDQINVTVGSIDQLNSFNFWQRSWGEPNLVQVTVRGNLSKIMSYMGEYTNYMDQSHFRAALDIATADILKAVDHVYLEEVIGTSTIANASTQQGFAISLQKTIKKFNITGTYSNKSASLQNINPNGLVLEDEYGQGQQLTVSVSRSFAGGRVIPFFMYARNLTYSYDYIKGGVKFTLLNPKKPLTKPQFDWTAIQY